MQGNVYLSGWQRMAKVISQLLLVSGMCTCVAPPSAAQLNADEVFAYDGKRPLNLTNGKSESIDGVTVSEIWYDSPKIGRVPGYLVVPPGKGPFGAIVYLHWGGSDKSEFLSEALDWAKRGVAVGLMIDAPYWRADVPQPSSDKRAEWERDGYIQMVVDLRRGVDLLLARTDVDPNRIAYVGHSFGATWGAPLAAVEKRIKVFVLMGGLPKMPPDWDDDSFFQQVQRNQGARAEFDREVAVLKDYQPQNFAAKTGPAKIYFQWAKHDMYISQHSAEEYFKAVGGPKEQHWYFTSHEFNDELSRQERTNWLMQAIGPATRVH